MLIEGIYTLPWPSVIKIVIAKKHTMLVDMVGGYDIMVCDSGYIN